MKANPSATMSAAVSHVLAWALFLWIVIGQCIDQCDFFLDSNGLWFLTAMFIPVILTGLALITLLIWTASRLGITLALGVLSVALLAFCGMGYLSYGWGYLPAAVALATAAIIFGVRPGTEKRHEQKVGLGMKFLSFRAAGVATVSATFAHVLAWFAFLWLALWPHAYQGVSATLVQVDELGNPVGVAESEVVRYSASLVEANGVGALIPLSIPLILTGLALMALLSWRGRSAGIVTILWVLAVVQLTFCLLASLSFGATYFPSALVLVIAAAIVSFRLRLPRVPQE